MAKTAKAPAANALPKELSSYLLLVHDLIKEKGYVRGVELADRLQMSRPTVTRAIQRLAALGFANYERYRGITLTAAGESAAVRASERFAIVSKFLAATGASLANPELEARRLAAYCSDDVIAAFEVATRKLSR
jgi:Mn-dependent DtxR family transcriptional regulator